MGDPSRLYFSKKEWACTKTKIDNRDKWIEPSKTTHIFTKFRSRSSSKNALELNWRQNLFLEKSSILYQMLCLYFADFL